MEISETDSIHTDGSQNKYIPLLPNISYYLDSKTNKGKFSDST